MTAVGKILVFLNLVFSLVVGAFVIMIYLARTHWSDEYTKLKNQYDVVQSSARTYQAESIKAREERDAEIAKVRDELKNAQQDLTTANTTVVQLRDELAKVQKKSNEQNSLAKTYGTEVVKRQEDVAQLRETLRKEQESNNALVKKNTELSNEATVAKIERQSALDLAKRVETELQRVEKEMVRMRANGGATATVRAGGKNPPQENIEGLVSTTDSSGLMTLTIGSDAGLTRGNTLELFRLNPSAPSQSKYLGTVRILEADAHQAVAQPVGRLAAPARKGDRVASRILGS